MKHMILVVVCAAILAAPALGDWSEDFQSYGINSLIDGQGGWAGWDGGHFSAYVTNEKAKFEGDKVLKLNAANNDMVHEYADCTSGAWVYTARQFLPRGTATTGTTSFILMNKYISGDATAKGYGLTLTLNRATGVVYDVQAAEVIVPIVFDQWVTIRVEIDLDANFRTVYYNGAKLSVGPWYDPSDASHAKSIAAVDLYANAGGNPIYYDDLSLTPGTPASLGTDLTTYPGRAARYLVNMGRGSANTSIVKTGRPSGLHEFTSGGGNQNAWFHLNNGNPCSTSTMVTFLGTNPDYFGYKFKLPATVNRLVWWNRTFGDGGTFAATPELQYLDAVNGTWHTITDVTWDRPYFTLYTNFGRTDGVRRYEIALNNPPPAIWGIRLIGDAQPGADDDGNGGAGGTGFVGVTEMTLYGNLELGPLDLADNLAPRGTPIASYWEIPGHANALIDGDTGDKDAVGVAATTFHPDERDKFTGEDWMGIQWATPQNNVAAVGWTNYCTPGGGRLNPCHNMRIQVATDASLTDWQNVTGLDLGRYPADWLVLRSMEWAPHTAWLFRFDEVSGIYGIRLIGDPDGYLGDDLDGWMGTWEFEVFANAGGSASARPAQPTLANRIVESVRRLWKRGAL